jgi:cytosine/adenosine deaminase-related metal-dependent hydrolase
VAQVYGPWIFDGAGFVEGGVVVEAGRIVEALRSPPEDATHRCLVFPKLVNAHTHLGDAFIKRVPRVGVEELVSPPDGYKFRMLAEASRETIVREMVKALRAMGSSGTSAFVDFREGGLAGLRMLRRALSGVQLLSGVIMARPKSMTFDGREVARLLAEADGIGLSSVSEWTREELVELSTAARKAGKLFAIHASERKREPFGRVAELQPSFVVHMVKASAGDMRECAERGTPVVVCPRSNAFFRMKPPVRKMLDAGLEVALGTDNAMLATPDMLAEARFLARSQRSLSPDEVVRMTIASPRKVLNLEPGMRFKVGGIAEFATLQYSRGDPAKAFLSPGKKVRVCQAQLRR